MLAVQFSASQVMTRPPPRITLPPLSNVSQILQHRRALYRLEGLEPARLHIIAIGRDGALAPGERLGH